MVGRCGRLILFKPDRLACNLAVVFVLLAAYAPVCPAQNEHKEDR